MNKLAATLLLVTASLGTSALAQTGIQGGDQAPAPIVRQAPSQPVQQAQPDYPAPMPTPADQAPPPPPMAPQQIDQLVQRIALYPDSLLAQVLTASTFWYQIADAAAWANQHSYIHGDALAEAIQADNLSWDPSVLALLPFPSVLDMMARDPHWTGTLGNAVLNQRPDVMDAVQRERRIAHNYGYLGPNPYYDVVDNGGYLEIDPLNPTYYYVPIYDPAIVFFAPRPGFVVTGAIRFAPAIVIGPSFGVFGWFGAGFGWGTHAILIDHRPWVRTFANRGVYVHPYGRPVARPVGPRVESHPVRGARRGR